LDIVVKGGTHTLAAIEEEEEVVALTARGRIKTGGGDDDDAVGAIPCMPYTLNEDTHTTNTIICFKKHTTNRIDKLLVVLLLFIACCSLCTFVLMRDYIYIVQTNNFAAVAELLEYK
jgi:hypothetical protein